MTRGFNYDTAEGLQDASIASSAGLNSLILDLRGNPAIPG
jgi:hypothetical protein